MARGQPLGAAADALHAVHTCAFMHQQHEVVETCVQGSQRASTCRMASEVLVAIDEDDV